MYKRQVLVLGARDRESLALEPQLLQGQWESALVEINFVEDGQPLVFEAKEWECAWLGRGLHVPVAEDGTQTSKEKRFALATNDDQEEEVVAVVVEKAKQESKPAMHMKSPVLRHNRI